MIWTDIAQELLEQYARDGKSASDAGAALGITRSAVLGRAHRTGVKFRGPYKPGPGHPCSDETRVKLSAAWSPEARAAAGERKRAWWAERRA